MTTLWKRLQRGNKRAVKFNFTVSYSEVLLELNADSNWRPNRLSMVWSRRSRRVVSQPMDWDPSMKNPLSGSIVWGVPENHTVAVTLFKDPTTQVLEHKEWQFTLENISKSGRRNRIAHAGLNLCPYASVGAVQQEVTLPLRPQTTKVKGASVKFTISSVMLREGSANDLDMQSMASMMSSGPDDIGNVADFEDEVSFELLEEVTSKMQSMIFNIDKSTPSLNDGFYGANSSNAPPKTEPPVFTYTSPEPVVPPNGNESSYRPDAPLRTLPLTLNSNLCRPPLSPIADEQEISVGVYRNAGEGDMKSPVKDAPGESDPAPPAQALLEWCTECTKNSTIYKIVDLSSGWHTGLPFCALIHKFRPDLIDPRALRPGESCVRTALRASEALGVPCMFHAREVVRGPDRLALLTYLYQFREQVSRRQLRNGSDSPPSKKIQIEAKIPDSSPTASTIPPRLSPNLPTFHPNLASTPEVHILKPILEDEFSGNIPVTLEAPKKPAARCILPIKTINLISEVDSKDTVPESTNRLKTDKTPVNEDQRQAQLRERARKLIAEARANAVSPTSPDRVEILKVGTVFADTPTTPTTPQIILDHPLASLSPVEHITLSTPIINNYETDSNANSAVQLSPSSQLCSFANLLDRMSPVGNKLITSELGQHLAVYNLDHEQRILESEMAAIDKEACNIEAQLRAAMETKSSDEAALTTKWFAMVNHKNLLCKRHVRLNILLKDKAYSKRYTEVSQDLRELLNVEDWRKSKEQREREELLISTLFALVDERNQLVHHLHELEHSFNDDEIIEMTISKMDQEDKKNSCSIQ